MSQNYDLAQVNKLLDKTKASLFLGKNAAFYGSLMCQLNFIWDEDVEIAATDHISIYFNPHVFITLKPETRKFILLHELNHVSRLHALRLESRDQALFNIACDYVINNSLLADGYTFDDCPGFADPVYEGWSEEEVYKNLMDTCFKVPPAYVPDLKPCIDGAEKQEIIQIVSNAVMVAKNSTGFSTQDFATTEDILNTFLAPVVNWAEQLYRFFEDKIVTDTNWSRPNRRFQDMYLPSNKINSLDIDTLTYFVDVSGSVSDYDVQRFNSELKYVKDTFNVGEIHICQFDTRITSKVILKEEDDLTQVVTVGRGGTDLECVHRYMEEHKPKSVIIFSDLDCDPLPSLSYLPNLLYVVTCNPNAMVEYGSIIHI